MGSNLFQSLFVYRARPDVTPQENFLTESWAYLLSSHPLLTKQFVAWCMEGTIGADELRDDPVIETQVPYPGATDGCSVFPDLRIRFQTLNGQAGELLCEHKWQSPTDVEQLRCYAGLPTYGTNRRVIFVCSTQHQRDEALAWSDRVLLWSELHDWLEAQGDSGNIGRVVHEFREFLRLQGLVQREVDPVQVDSYEQYGQFMAERLADQLRFSWEALPSRLQKCRRLMGPRKRQVGIDFGDAAGPIVFAGYFLTGGVQPVEMCDPARGIDLVVVLFRKPGRDLLWQTVARMEERLRAVDPKLNVLTGKQTRNSWIVLSARRSLAEVAPTMTGDDADVIATYETLHSWCRAIFADPQVEREMREVWPEGW